MKEKIKEEVREGIKEQGERLRKDLEFTKTDLKEREERWMEEQQE